MAGISMEITGFDQLAAALSTYSETLAEQFNTRLQEIGQTAFDDMEGNSPVDTGNLQSGWQISQEETGFTITNDVEYTGFVEFGHSDRGGGFVPGQNWITPAYETMRSDIESLIQEVSGK